VIFEGLSRNSGAFRGVSHGLAEMSVSLSGDFLIVSAAGAGTGI